MSSLLEELFPAPPAPCCRVCGCSDNDPCIIASNGETCAWSSEDLCTFCVTKALVEVYGVYEAQRYIDARRAMAWGGGLL